MMIEGKNGGGTLPPPKVLILGVGNILLRDDGFGVRLIQSLEETAFPPNVQILETGTVSHQLIPEFRSIDYLIVIDVVEAGDAPGSIFRFSPDDMNFRSEQKLSLHQISLTDVLQMAALTGAKPKTVIIAVQPKNILLGLELSDEVTMAMPKVKELVFDELKKIKALENYSQITAEP
ncbi:MAG TPA: Ni,Fe-hydrogenase maturation factor [Nitrospiraceae bacterium]|nr:Ni,Fe-hydrogenase maturation factor [Nitrospiraceae bacterium]